MSPSITGWSQTVGILPHKVQVFAHLERKGVLYLRWRAGGNWRVRSLKRALTDDRGRPLVGRALKDAQAEAIRAAEAQYERNKAGQGDDAPEGHQSAADARAEAERAAARLTIRQGFAATIDPETGKYLTDTLARRDIASDIERAAVIWKDAPWATVRRAEWERLWRRRIRDVRAKRPDDPRAGFGAARATVARVHAVASWLRDRELIPAGAAVLPKSWRDDLAADFAQLADGARPTVHRPRYTLEESRALLAHAAAIDPRLALLLALGAELRAGQVLRAWRSDLTLDGPDAGAFGAVTVKGRGKKGGVVVELTRGQRAAVDEALGRTDGARGYLRALEARYVAEGLDFRLFPGGPLTQRGKWTEHAGSVAIPPRAPLASATQTHQRTAAVWLEAAERAAGIPKQAGRGLYGLRRAAVDAATTLKVSADALTQLGGWADEATPNRIYRDAALVLGRTEARNARATIRGEADPPDPPPEALPNGVHSE